MGPGPTGRTCHHRQPANRDHAGTLPEAGPKDSGLRKGPSSEDYRYKGRKARGMTRPKLLDLFCCAGGAGMGYHRAGFEVVGVDILPQPHYPFEFIKGDVFELLPQLWFGFDVIHSSPKCQKWSTITKTGTRKEYPDQIAPLREMFRTYGKP